MEQTVETEVMATLGTPKSDGRLNEATLKRMRWVADEAAGAATPETAADKIQIACNEQTRFGDGGRQDWAMLDGGSGDCLAAAKMMSSAVRLLGITAETSRVFASSNAGAGNCSAMETDTNGWTLRMDFNKDLANPNWNEFEGVSIVAGKYYAVHPKKKEDNDYQLLKSLTMNQHWCEISKLPNGREAVTNTRPQDMPEEK